MKTTEKKTYKVKNKLQILKSNDFRPISLNNI